MNPFSLQYQDKTDLEHESISLKANLVSSLALRRLRQQWELEGSLGYVTRHYVNPIPKRKEKKLRERTQTNYTDSIPLECYAFYLTI